GSTRGDANHHVGSGSWRSRDRKGAAAGEAGPEGRSRARAGRSERHDAAEASPACRPAPDAAGRQPAATNESGAVREVAKFFINRPIFAAVISVIITLMGSIAVF